MGVIVLDWLIEKYKKLKEKVTGSDYPTYDEYFNLIYAYKDDSEALYDLAEEIRANPNLTEDEKERLWELIDKEIKLR